MIISYAINPNNSETDKGMVEILNFIYFYSIDYSSENDTAFG